MAQMIPSFLAPETPSSERRLYQRFRAVLPDSWTVIHSQRFLLTARRRGRVPPREGEIDFLILDPTRGLLALEVKGGRVQRTPDGWYSTDRHGERHSIKDPGRLALQFTAEQQELLRLTEEQIAMLDSLAAHNRAVIEGAAGTGKTVLAMEKARRLTIAGARVLLLCFNRPLAAHLCQQADGFTVETFHDLCERLARRSGLPFDAPEERHPRHRSFWEEETPMLLLRALERLPDERYDAIVVDEGQDFPPDWWPCLDEALAQGREGTLYAFYDAHQNIFGGHLPPEALEVMETRLVFNCRNTTRIAEYAARLMAIEPRVKVGAPQGDEVEEIVCRNAEEMVRRVAGRLTHLVDDEGIKPARIAILSTRTLGNSPFADDHRAGRFDLVSLDADLRLRRSRDRVVYETLYRYKGLEADVVILLDLPDGSKAVEPRDLYVAATRAKHLLVVMRFARAR